ncbi:hypothetical protein ESCO_001816 [Escovopsis weberi]|uniref:Uncharacterized protein n=1 Tax=Escovopsis weberi TaxID=150374 RepID=A0A0M8N8V7_ESCWE|nr:hypothetical protein ESCO_001816 [Escovopsis weberi]
MQQSLKRALELLPDLSVSDCRVNLSPNFFQAHCLRDLVFLDISGLTGSLSCILRPSVLGSLRILKVGKREIDDRTGTLLANVCGRRLWSLDLSGNKLTDSIIESLMDTCLPLTDLRSAARSQVEGKLVSSGYGTQQHGPFWFIQESRWSASFSHPERYLVDAPKYRPAARTETSYLGDLEAQRSDCRSPPRLDCADPVSQLLLSDPDPLFAADHAPASRGITHLSLSNNEVSAFGIDKLFRKSGGHLSHFACSKMPILPTYSACSRVWPRSARLYGIMGKEHVFRPVGDGGFSFFETNRAAAPHIGVGATTRSRSALAGAPQPADQDHREFVPHNTRWNAKTFTLQVWAGTPSLATSNAHMREYRRLVLGCLIREGVGPVTPSQVRVGAPMAGYIFQRTWSMAVMPPRIEAPRTMELANMRSVINALCEYHQQGFAKLDKEERELGKGRVPPGPPHWYWRGKLDVCLM